MSKFKHNYSPNVSVVMPVYNGARTIMEAVDSVLNQTYRDFELIICNDASTDNTPRLLNNIKDDRVRVIHNSKNLGEGPARDRAIEVAQGFWLAFIDADDAWAPERLEIMLHEAGTSEDIILFDNIWECHDTPSGMVPWRILRKRRVFGGNGKDTVEVPIEKYICERRLVKSAFFPLDYIKKYELRHSRLPFFSDTEFFLKLLSHDMKLFYIPKPMYYYRITQGSMSGLTKRFVLMHEILENAINDFKHAPNVQFALRKKISQVIRSEHYMLFILAKKRKEIYKVLQIVYHCPWVIPEYFRNLIKGRLLYDVHRIWHGGLSRGER